MAELPLTSATIALAGRAADLSADVYHAKERCGHTSDDVENVANEIAMLAVTLRRLHESMLEDPNRYTDCFKHDLAEIIHELNLVFEEISECCRELQKADPTSGNVVSWLFKISKVHHLQKHFQVLKTTLMVMRTVLHHGRDSPDIAESQPHTMHEDRAILDTVLAGSGDAIIDIHNLEQSAGDTQKAVDKDAEQVDMNNSNPQIPGIPGVLPTVPRSPPATSQATSGRSFSILGTGAHTRSLRSPHGSMSGAISPDMTRMKTPSEESLKNTNLSPNKKDFGAAESDGKSNQ